MKDMGDSNHGGVFYGFTTTGDSWRMLSQPMNLRRYLIQWVETRRVGSRISEVSYR